VAYALESRAAFALVVALAFTHLVTQLGDGASPLPFWALLAATAPYLVSLARRPSVSARDTLLAWVVAPVLVLASLLQMPLVSGLWLGALAFSVAAGLYAIGAPGDEARLPAPFAASASRQVGAGATAFGVLLLCFSEVWDGVARDAGEWLGIAHAAPALALAALALVAAAWRARQWWGEGEWARLLWLAAPAAYGLAFALGLATDSESVAAWSMAVYALALGSATVLAGLAEGALGRANAGMLLLAAAIGLRFVDTDWSFTVRGLVFIVLGAGFLAFNLYMRGRLVRETQRAETLPAESGGES
jgi:hypothetical protein